LRRARGSTLILVLILLIITVAASAYFHNSMVGSTRVSGGNRDNAASMLMAESAMELLRGGFMNKLYTGEDICVIEDGSCDDKYAAYEGLFSPPAMENKVLIKNALATLDYIYFAVCDPKDPDCVPEKNTGLTEKLPSILQKVANGEADDDISDNPSRVNGFHQVTAEKMNINDLFSGALKPMMYKTNDNGLLIDSGAANWTGEPALEKAVAWIELTKHDEDDVAVADATGGIDIWVEAVGQAGFAKSYLQSYAGTWYPPTMVGNLAALIEATNKDRRRP